MTDSAKLIQPLIMGRTIAASTFLEKRAASSVIAAKIQPGALRALAEHLQQLSV